jgi:hypothetical protein
MKNAECRKPASATALLPNVGEESRGGTPRKHQENTKRIRRKYEENTIAPPQHPASIAPAWRMQLACTPLTIAVEDHGISADHQILNPL